MALPSIYRTCSEPTVDRRILTCGLQERAIKETEAIFGPLREKIDKATGNLEDALSAADGATPDELEKAKKAVEDAKAALSA